MTYDEFLAWVAYRAKRGSLHFGMRIESAVATLSALFANAHSKGGFTPHDFAPHHDEPAIDLETAMERWK